MAKFVYDPETEMYHFGVLGMKWGERKYQNPDGSLTDEGRDHYGVGAPRSKSEGKSKQLPRHTGAPKNRFDAIRQKIAKKKAEKKRLESLQKARQARAEKKAYEEGKAKAIEKGDINEVMKYKGDLDPVQMNYINNRLNQEAQLQMKYAQANPPKPSTMDQIDKVMNDVDRINNWTQKGIRAYNTMALINNSLSDEKWPPIDGRGIDKNAEAKKVLDKEITKAIQSGDLSRVQKYYGKMDSKQLSDAIKVRSSMNTIDDMKYVEDVKESRRKDFDKAYKDAVKENKKFDVERKKENKQIRTDFYKTSKNKDGDLASLIDELNSNAPQTSQYSTDEISDITGLKENENPDYKPRHAKH